MGVWITEVKLQSSVPWDKHKRLFFFAKEGGRESQKSTESLISTVEKELSINSDIEFSLSRHSGRVAQRAGEMLKLDVTLKYNRRLYKDAQGNGFALL